MDMASSYTKLTSEHLDKLAGILATERVSSRADDLVISSRDVYPYGEFKTRKGEIEHRPDCVVWPESTAEVSRVIQFANENKIPVIPYGGGSGVCGGTIPLHGGIMLDLKKMDRIRSIDDYSLSARIESGAVGEILERELNESGYTIGHFPSSMYCSTLGGWIAARGAGQLSTLYGKIEDMVLSLEAVLPDGGVMETNNAPREATGPDIDQVIIGSEGALAVVTAATMKLHHLPEAKVYASFLFPYITNGLESMRKLMRAEAVPSVARLYDEVDTRVALSKLELEGKGCLMVLLFEGDRQLVEWEAEQAWQICMREGAKDMGEEPARQWEKTRYHISYKQSQVLFEPGAVLDTIEVATTWSDIAQLYFDVKDALDGLCFVMAHFSHIYPEGGSIYFTCVAGAKEDLSDLELYRKIWDAAMEVVLKHGATVSHHHGIGLHKADYLKKQMGPLADVYRRLKAELDPNNILNPSKMGL